MTTVAHPVNTGTFAPSPTDLYLSNIVLSHRSTFFPLGFPLEVMTNSPEVLAASAKSWNVFHHRFDMAPLQLKLSVTSNPNKNSILPEAPLCRAQDHLLTHIADQYNFVSCDLNTGLAFGWITEQTAQSSLYLRYHFLETAALSMLAASRVCALHAACVSINGYGILLCGDSGAGKSSLAFAGAKSGWTFTSDDASYLLQNRTHNVVVGNCYQFRLRDSGAQLFSELQGRPITPRAAGKPSIEIPAQELSGITTAESTTVKAIIFLNRSPTAKPELLPFPKESARSWLHQSAFPHTASNRQQLASIDGLLNLPVYELRYTRLEHAIDRLNQLAQIGT